MTHGKGGDWADTLRALFEDEQDVQTAHPVNRRYKDTLFRDLFGSPGRREWALELYNALAGTGYDDPDGLVFTTLDDVIYLNYKNDVSFVVGDELALVEHQSTPNPNMPLRGLVYFGRLYAAIANGLGDRLYGRKLVELPPARFGELIEARLRNLGLDEAVVEETIAAAMADFRSSAEKRHRAGAAL